MNPAEMAARFRERFADDPRIFSAPGRVNLIGEHTDYNDGFVMPSAIGFAVRTAISSRPDRNVVLHSADFPERFEFSLDDLPQSPTGAWADYLIGVMIQLCREQPLSHGANVLVSGEVPVGAGLSSSAAIEVASALAFMDLNGIAMPLRQVAKLCQRAENTFVGANCGIMDQFVSCMGTKGHALFLDCRSLEFQTVPFPDDVRVVICNTMVKHSVAGGEYNRRRAECEQGVRLLTRHYPEIRALRDVTLLQLQSCQEAVPNIIYRRCEHVIRENDRVIEGCRALAMGDLVRFGELMRESHQSLRDLYEVSCAELDLMVSLAGSLPGCLGARMTGGGFGGCTVNLVKAADAKRFAARIAEGYRERSGVQPDVYVCAPSDGAHAEPVEVPD
jgi:galactokinase